ncbi:helix-turn-helix transcriptional regulator (plasmid) [Spirosoma taeanense]|uniref:Helix-turn-helix transcriptional regulator n=1 Tax=Spirosoma taeanense TaxID=2735870 RepID=A0A6M5YFV8_9BACT|nr:helix-turn-helix transcriptional regulator [Spirosoma taeanense]QJW92494.1 helix-turn-helix transcriptional regulator [Spirosoma taeanense]
MNKSAFFAETQNSLCMENSESAKRLKAIVVALDMKVTDFGEAIGVKQQQIYDWTSGKFIPKFPVWVQIAERFPQLSAEFILRGKGAVLNE